MRTKKNRYRWATLTLLIVLMTAAAVWCGLDRADWQEATSANIEPSLAERFLSSLKSKPEPDLRALRQRVLEIGDQVVGVFNAQRDASEAVADRITPAGAPVH
jgi:hypothetical protein